MTITDFYQSEFNSDPYELVRAAADELRSVAEAAGIDWFANADDIRLQDGNGPHTKFRNYTKRAPKTLTGTRKGSADIYSRIENRDGLIVPFINFVRHGSGAGEWSGHSFLWEAYKAWRSRCVSTVTQDSEAERRHALRREQAEARRAERDRLIERNRLINNQNDHERLAGYLDFHRAFDAAPVEDGTFPYVLKKKISDGFGRINVRRVLDWDRSFSCRSEPVLAIPLSHLDGRYDGKIVSWQRINASGGKFQTAAVPGYEYSGACFVIGSLRDAKRVCVTEGFATGMSIWLAERKRFDAVIVAVSANNMMPVVEQLADVYEAVKVWLALDNDQLSAQKGKGNTGVLAGLEIMRRFPGVVCTRPAFTETEISDGMSDFNDVHATHGLPAVCAQFSSKANRLKPATDLDAELMKLSIMPRRQGNLDDNKKFMRQLMRCVDVGMKSCPAVRSPRELIAQIADYMQRMNGQTALMKNVKSRVERLFSEKCQKAQAFRSFSSRITDPSLRPDHITYKRFKSPQITPEVLEYIERLDGPVIVRAGMGSGKSKHLIRPLMHKSGSGISAAHRVSLIGGLWDMMTRNDDNQRMACDILHYQDPGYQEMAPFARKVTICINSIVKGCWKPLMNSHDLFALDEATQGLRAILSGRAMEEPTRVFNRLIDSLACSKERSLLVDADASDILVDLCELALARRERMGIAGWTQIHVVELPVDVAYRETPDAEPQKRRVLYTDKERIVTEVMAAVKAGEKFLLATDSTNFAEALMTALRESWPEKRWLYVSQDTKPEPDVIAFTDAPNQQATQYDGLIYSPAISSGVSIETAHFTRHFGMFCGQIVPSDAIQMLRRDRTAREFMIGLSSLPGYKEEDADKIRHGVYLAMLETASAASEFTDIKIESDELRLGLADTPYARLKFRIAAMEAAARNEFANNLICILFADGYAVEHLAEDADLSAAGKEIRKDALEKNWLQTVDRHLLAETPTEQLRDELMAKRALSADEAAQLTRWEIEHELKQPVSEDSLKFLMDGGRKKLALAELMRMDEAEALKIDRDQLMFNFTYQFRKGTRTDFVNIVAAGREQADEQFARIHLLTDAINVTATPVMEAPQRTYAAVHRKALRQYFETCGINPDTCEGETTNEAMQAAMDQLMEPSQRNKFNNVLRFGGYSSDYAKPKRPSAVFKQVCEAVGLEAVKRRGNRAEGLKYVWSILPASNAFISDVLAQRAEAGQSFFVQKPVQAPCTDKASQSDPNISEYIYKDQKFGSQDAAESAGLDAVQEAIDSTPVSFAWVRSILTGDELIQLAAMPIRAIRATLSALYLTENIGNLTAGEYDELRRLQTA
ncbi:plasmid replication protein, CyRepA1 family [Mixta calida]|uniref:plasmid replication protein, CyRepA1 family n=1 Tax=Mixta calida TaxID=665913 RepID=UPI00290F336C|nr:plasmid replication protein, CyRepA1 family [Mixta calida]MDU4291129.1 plasmid replication protein, CyRepA1 family [Mixta calida]